MSLDERAEEQLVRLTIDGLETIALAADKISEPVNCFTDEDRRMANRFLGEYTRALHLGVPSYLLRQSFLHISNIVTQKAKSPVSELYSLLTLMCVSGTVFSGVKSGIDMSYDRDSSALPWLVAAGIGLFGVGVSSFMQYRANLKAKRDMSRDSSSVFDASDVVWKEALSRLYDKKRENGDFYE